MKTSSTLQSLPNSSQVVPAGRPLMWKAAMIGCLLGGHASASTAADAQATVPASPTIVSFSGEVRSRSEWDAPGNSIPSDVFTFLRTRFGVRVDTDAGVRLVLQAQDSRVLGAEGHPASARVSEFGLHQAYVELRGRPRGHPMVLRAGRQEIAIGNERLMGAVNWSNLGRSFDGLRVTLTSRDTVAGAERWSTSLFAATVEERGRHFGSAQSRPKHDHVLAGLAGNLSLPRGIRADATALYDVSGDYRHFTNSDRVTVDARIRAPLAQRFSLELESALQLGHQRDESDSTRIHAQPVQAWMFGIRGGYSGSGTRKPSLVVGADVLSGDADPHNANYGAFNTLYGSNHSFYGLMDVIADPAATTHERGVVDVFGGAGVVFNNRVSMRAEAHRFSLATGAARDIGWEADVTMPVRVLPTTTLDIGYSAYRAGRDAESHGLGARGSVRDWAFVQLRVGF